MADADLHGAGRDPEGSRILSELIVQDDRCIDAWVHLGNIAFDAKGPKAALQLYHVAVAIGEQSLPEGFTRALRRGLIDNRPFLRALHGLGLYAQRQRRWPDAALIFTNLVWIDGCETWTSLECLEAVEAHDRWSRLDAERGESGGASSAAGRPARSIEVNWGNGRAAGSTGSTGSSDDDGVAGGGATLCGPPRGGAVW